MGSGDTSSDRKLIGKLILAVESCLTDLISMRLCSKLLFCLIFLGLTQGLPTPSKSSMAPFGVVPLVYSRRSLSPPNGQSSATEHSAVDRSPIWGGTPANTSICRGTALWTGNFWWIMLISASFLVLLYGLVAFVMWDILSIDLPRLTVWNRTGNEGRR